MNFSHRLSDCSLYSSLFWPCPPKQITGSISMLWVWWPIASSRSASGPMFFLELCQSLARRSESLSRYHVKFELNSMGVVCTLTCACMYFSCTLYTSQKCLYTVHTSFPRPCTSCVQYVPLRFVCMIWRAAAMYNYNNK